MRRRVHFENVIARRSIDLAALFPYPRKFHDARHIGYRHNRTIAHQYVEESSRVDSATHVCKTWGSRLMTNKQPFRESDMRPISKCWNPVDLLLHELQFFF